jgi:hypothetical protein
MLNPPGDAATVGRLNATGISRLYLSSTHDVAAAEVRAVTGDYVTIAKFNQPKKISVFDFREMERKAEDRFKDLLGYIKRIIAFPVFTYDNYECVLSQWITEYMQLALNIDALIYPSVMRGQTREERKLVHDILKIGPREFYNVCAFYPAQFQLVDGSESVMRVRELSLYVATDEVYYKIKAIREIGEHPERISAKKTSKGETPAGGLQADVLEDDEV